jgi:hypothetical protein
MAMDFAIIGSFVRSGSLSIRFVRWTATLLYDSKPRLATTPLRFFNPSPPSGWMEEHHLQISDQPPSRPKAPHEAAPIVSLGKENREGRVSPTCCRGPDGAASIPDPHRPQDSTASEGEQKHGENVLKSGHGILAAA